MIPSEGKLTRKVAQRRPFTVSVLDIGSSKIVCLIAKLRPRGGGDVLPGRTHSIEVLGIGHQRSRGVKSGMIVDLDQAEQAIRLAVDAAERMARVTVDSLIVSVSAGRLGSETFAAEVAVGHREVGEDDIGRVLSAGRMHSLKPTRSAVHSLPVGYSLDGERAIRDPRGMLAERLGVDMHVVTVDGAPLRNLDLCLSRCHLNIETVVASPYASGLAALVDDEAQLGCVAVDLGAGTTSMAVFADGHFIHTDGIALGAHHVTLDIARGLSTRLEEAERLKVMHGSALALGDDREILSVSPIGDDEHEMPRHVPRAALGRIVRARIEEILEVVRDRLNASGFAPLVGRRVVLTGGGSQLTGLADAARRILARNVRLGRPLGVAGMPEVAKGPAFSTAVGLLIYPQVAELEQLAGEQELKMTGTGGGYFARFGHWFRQSF